MKSFYLFTLILLVFSSCKGAKKVINDSPTSEQEKKVMDTITTTKKVIKMTDSLVVPQDKKDIEIIEKPIIRETPLKIVFNHETFHTLLKKYVSNNGNVNYKGLKSDWKALRKYLDQLGKNLPDNNWSKNEKLAYWINAYNAMTIDLILRHYPIKSIKDIKNPWKQRYWQLGEKWYNLDEIEHQILRKMDEPRIHFAIVCASYSCPKLQNEAFTASKLEQQLTSATKEFLNDPERNAISKNSLELSKIFQWFAKDFKQNGDLIDFLNAYTHIEISKNAKKQFKDYSWDLNE
ncbi:DUF547 domain-containing protein [Hyunsoonleella ulvae]|uniref:DUF547 domain-containing protein n=1 Tax=Hyunsoonleella ulvae TaxID=2799948 RepID=UPI00193959FA|nr:DUF547 domain-containing protein [Hyunsoonleella ulvae]